VRIAGTGLHIARLAYRGEPLEGPLAVLWDRLRPLPRYAEGFPASFAAYLCEVRPAARHGENGRLRWGEPEDVIKLPNAQRHLQDEGGRD
jgi:hypothetical protein